MSAFAAASRAGILAAAVAFCAPALAQAQARLQSSLTLYDQPDYRGGSVTFYGDNANIGSTGFASRARSAQVRGAWRLCEGGGYRNRCEVLSANVRDLGAYGLSGRVGSAQLMSGAAAYAPPGAPQERYAQPYGPAGPAPYAPPPAYAGPYGAAPNQPGPDEAPPAVDAPGPGPSRYGYGPYAPPAAPSPYGAQTYAPAPATSGPDSYGAEPAPGSTAVFFPAPAIRGADVAAWTPRAADGFCRAQGLGGAIYFDQSQRLPRAVDIDGRAVGEGPVLRDVLCRR